MQSCIAIGRRLGSRRRLLHIIATRLRDERTLACSIEPGRGGIDVCIQIMELYVLIASKAIVEQSSLIHHINPFELPLAREDESGADVLRSHIISLVSLFRIMLGGLSPEEDSLIDRGITETYALKDITADSNFANVEPPLMSDFELDRIRMTNLS